MSLVAVAVCPHPPLLLPEIASGASPELDDLRDACAEAVASLRDAGARSVVVIGAASDDPRVGDDASEQGDRGEQGDASERCDRGERGYRDGRPGVVASLAEFGVPLSVALPDALLIGGTAQRAGLPLSLTVAVWLLRDLGLPVRLRTVPASTPPTACATWTLPEPAERPWGLLVMGDGSARRGEKAPGYADPRAEAFDARVATALAQADTDALMALDPQLAAELMCVGRAPWQVLAGAVARRHGSPGGKAPAWVGRLHYDKAPYGVAYVVATWRPSGNALSSLAGTGLAGTGLARACH